ncbi:MAG: hypothetical protein IPK82_00715 [Polyangiaceae bacterium]|nr:hypothetical protein [Polyangiaceae bacterium]
MEHSLQKGRGLEHDLRDDHEGEGVQEPGVRGGPSQPYSYYKPLATLTVKNSYNNGQDGRSSDLLIRPTTTTVTLLKSLNLLFKPTGDGFLVLYNQRHEFGLLQYIRNNAIPDTGEYWTRLSFTLTVRNPYFIGATRFPIAANPVIDNFYLTNIEARKRCGIIRLNPPGAFLPKNRFPVLPVEFEMRVPLGGGYQIIDISGTVVSFAYGVEQRRPPGTAPDRRRKFGDVDILFVQMGLLPEAKYFVQATDAWGEPAPAYSLGWCIYTAAAPAPLFFFDLLFARPYNGCPGIFPIDPTSKGVPSPIEQVDYTLQFFARSTTFRYRIIQDTKARYSGFQIESAGGCGPTFSADLPVTLPDGTTARQIQSNRRVKLAQQPQLHLRLKGLRNGQWEPLVDRLPIPTPMAVTPLPLAQGPDAPDPFNSLLAQPTAADVYIHV